MSRGGRMEPTPPECALAAEMFHHFCSAGTMKQILALHREICNTLNLKPNRLPDFYPKLKAKLSSSWKAQALFREFDIRANHKAYGKGQLCTKNKVLIIGAGPCGMRAAIECQLLGAKVVVIEKRDRISRNNVLHLWPFVIHDLRALGAKKFFGKFCAGSIDHISIRQLQCILLKVSLLLGVEFHEGVSFEELLEPIVTKKSETLGWRARVLPTGHPVSQYEFDVLIGADGKRNTLQGFKRKEFRGKLAMAITANFINRHSEQEASVPEISGVAFIFHQKFFKDLYEKTGIDLENIVYYKDDTHYFVMTAKKHSLLDKGVLLNDYNEVSKLLSVENVDRGALMRYAQEAARFSTNDGLPLLDFALNHYGEPDIALFDFTSMYAAENASMVYERHGRRVLCQLVGDSLLEPFWPTGSGCARGFLSALDSAWAVRSWGQMPPIHPLEVIAERESIYRLLAQTTPGNLHRDFGAYTLDPATRYRNLNKMAVTPHRVVSFYDSDEPLPLDATSPAKKRRREPEISEEVLVAWVGCEEPGLRAATSPAALTELLKRYRPDLLSPTAPPRSIYLLLQQEFGITLYSSNSSPQDVSDAKLRSYLLQVYNAFKGEVPHVQHSIDMYNEIKQSQQLEKNRKSDYSSSLYSNAVDSEKSHSSYKRKRRPCGTSKEEGRIVGGGGRTVGGGATVARLAAELSVPSTSCVAPKASKPKDLMRSVGKIERDDWNVKEIERKIMENRMGRPEPKTAEKVPKWDREQFLVRQKRLKEGDSNEEKWGEIDETLHKLDQKLNDAGRPTHGTRKVADLAIKFVQKDDVDISKAEPKEEAIFYKKTWRTPQSMGMLCAACGTRVFAAEGVVADGLHLHRACFRCAVCKTVLRPGNYKRESCGSQLVCLRHSRGDMIDRMVHRHLLMGSAIAELPPTPERISVELSDGGAREIDEDEWTDRNFLASETSGAGALSDEEESSSEEYTDAGDSEGEAEHSPVPDVAALTSQQSNDAYFSDDSFGYDDYSDDGAESSGNESCSRMRAAREARRLEVPAEARPPSDSSEAESEEESETSDEEISSATEVSTDSEFAREESVPPPSPPAILVTEAPLPVPPPAHEYPLSRARSAGGLATKRALELKRKYLLGEPSPPTVRKSDSTSQLDTKLEAFRSNITEFQKLLNPAPTEVQKAIVAFQPSTEDKKVQPMPDVIKTICTDASVDLLTESDPPLRKEDWAETIKEETVLKEITLDSDSLTEDSSHTETGANQSVPRVEVHDEGGELIQLDSLTIVNSNTEDNESRTPKVTSAIETAAVTAESESSESCRDATTLALTETELSDWAAESAVLDECGFEEQSEKKRNKNPRMLSGPKLVHDAKNLSAIASHVCGRTSPTQAIVFSNALDHFQFVDEGEQDLSVETPATPRNDGYMVFVDDEYERFSPTNDRSMNFIERSYSETTIKPSVIDSSESRKLSELEESIDFIDDTKTESSANVENLINFPPVNLLTEKESVPQAQDSNGQKSQRLSTFSPPLVKDTSYSEDIPDVCVTRSEPSLDDMSPPLASENAQWPISVAYNNKLRDPVIYTSLCKMHHYTPICRSASETFSHSKFRTFDSTKCDISINEASGTKSSLSPILKQNTSDKVQEIKKEREEQTEVVRRLVLERLGSKKGNRKSTRRCRISASSNIPPPIPPPPTLATPPPPPPPTYNLSQPRPSPPLNTCPPLMPLPVSTSLSDPELARDMRPKGIMKSISNYFNRHLGPRHKERQRDTRKSAGPEEAPPVPPPPVDYVPPHVSRAPSATVPVGNGGGVGGVADSDEFELYLETRWTRPVHRRRGREEPREEPSARRLARLERRLARPLSAEQEAATVAELVQVSAQREARYALMAADSRRRNAASNGVGD